jgi:RNase P protein component
MRQGFLAFRDRAKQQATPHLRMLYSPHAPSRLSVVVPAKVNKRATTRADLRRLSYDYFWPLISEKNLDCVIIFKPLSLKADKSSQESIRAELKNLHV